MTKPTYEELAEKVRIYEDLFHNINLHIVACDFEAVREYVSRIDRWSYMHRCGNGEPTEEEQDAMVRKAMLEFEKPVKNWKDRMKEKDGLG